MKRQALLWAVCGLLGFAGVGCGGTNDEPIPPSGEQSSDERPSEGTAPSEGEGAQEQPSHEGEVQQLARNCKTTCTAVRMDTGAACASVTGYGATTFLGGCTKACRFAHENAESNAMASGCRIVACNDECR